MSQALQFSVSSKFIFLVQRQSHRKGIARDSDRPVLEPSIVLREVIQLSVVLLSSKLWLMNAWDSRKKIKYETYSADCLAME